MNGARGLAATVAALVLAAASACSALTPADRIATTTECATLTAGSVMRALREAPSYEFRMMGTIARYDTAVGDADLVEHVDARGDYIGPDRFDLVFSGHESKVAELRQIGADHWARTHGSLRWRAANNDPDPPEANQLLAEIERITSWSAPDADSDPGWCILVGRDEFALDGQSVSAEVSVATAIGDSVPAQVSIDYRYEPPETRAGALSSRQLRYEIDSPAQESLRIDPPTIDMTPATDEDLRYALRHLGCHEAPCSIDNLRIVYAYRGPKVEMVGWEAGGRAGEAWFDSGRIRHVVKRCITPAFSWHEHAAEDGTTYLGGPLTLVDSATLRVSYSDGSSEELPIAGPAYVVPYRVHTDDGASIISVELLSPDGSLLLESPIPGHEEHSTTC